MKKKILTYMTLTTLLLSCDFTEKLNHKFKDTTAFVREIESTNNANENIDDNFFDVDDFLKWMAANNIMKNWDVDGDLTQNYYLYNNPESGLLKWIPWNNSDLYFNGVEISWSFIKDIISDEKYKKTYDLYVKQFIDEVFISEGLQDKYSEYYKLIAA